MAKVSELVEDLSWVKTATKKEIEDEILILNEELDEIRDQLNYKDNHSHSWRVRAIHAARHKRKQIKLILKIAQGEGLILKGEGLQDLNNLKVIANNLEAKLNSAKKKVEKKEKEIVGLKRCVKKQTKAIENYQKLTEYLRNSLDKETLKVIRKVSECKF